MTPAGIARGTVLVRVGDRAGRVRVQMGVTTMVVRQVHVDPPCGAGRPEAKCHERQSHQQLGPRLRADRDAHAGQRERAPHHQHHQRVPQRPSGAEPHGGEDPRAAAHEGGDGHHVVYLERVARAQRERGGVDRPRVVHAALFIRQSQRQKGAR